MKKLLVLLLATVFIFTFTTVALAGGYKSPDHPTIPGYYKAMPHYGYDTGTNLCKTCHAVHLATGTYKLLRDNEANTACDYCHVGSGAHTEKVAYGGNDLNPPTAAGHAHTIGVALTTTLDTSKDFSGKGNLVCNTCHTVHGANTITSTQEDILRGDPAKDEDGNLAADKDAFCADCHSKNLNKDGLNKTSHIMSALTPGRDVAWSPSTNCKSCHGQATDYPHSAGSYKLLGNVDVEGHLDASCIDCHINPSDPDEGVGETY